MPATRTSSAASRRSALNRPEAKRKRTDHRLIVGPPFHLEATVRILQRRPANRVDVWENGSYIRLLGLPQGLTLVRVFDGGRVDRPDLRYAILAGPHSLATHAAVRLTLSRVLGLDHGPGALQRLARIEPALLSTVCALRGMRAPQFADLFESFASVIPFQQLSLDAGIAILAKLVERFGEQLPYQERRYFAFPRAQTIASAHVLELQQCGLSAKKAETLQRIARAIYSGELSEHSLVQMDTVEALERLTSFPGVGPWTAGLVLLRGLGRRDVFPTGDRGAARALRELLDLREHDAIETVTARFGVDRGYLYSCCLGAKLLARGLISASPPPQR